MTRITVLVVMGMLLPCGARADGYIPFTDYLPPTTLNAEEYQSGYNDYCRDDRGRVDTYRCVDKVIREMKKRYDVLWNACDHRGIFALAYLETTKEYQRASLEPGFFRDPEFLNHEDVIFAQLYFDAYDDWQAGRMQTVPPAWRLAFSASSQKRVNTSGDVLLGISAHINRDLPIVLATIGLTDPVTGQSRKPDHDKVNAFLARVQLDPAVQAAWDPDYVSGIPGTNSVTLSLIQTWREAAWRWAERLVGARTPAEEADVLAQIELYAYEVGLGLQASNSYLAPLQTSASRDAYCAQHNAQ
jgi:Family of unknown function (DUF5995)